MTTVTGLTADRMLAIEAASVVDGDVVGDNLILTKHDGSTIDAGSVRGPIGPTGPAGLSLAVVPTKSVLDVGLSGQIRAGRPLIVSDFTTLCGLPSTPVGLFNLSSVANLGSGAALTNKGPVGFINGIDGVASSAAQFIGDTARALYIADSGVADPFRVKTGSFGCWARTTKSGTAQDLVTKLGGGGSNAYELQFNNVNNSISFKISLDGSTWGVTLQGVTQVRDDRWYFVVATYDGTSAKLYIDGNLDAWVTGAGPIFAGTGPLNIGSYGANSTTAAANPVFGAVDEAFITPDVLSEEQVRMLYCAKIAHGFTSTPKLVITNVRRRVKGPQLVSADFPAQPLRLYNLANLNDLGSNNIALAANAGTGAIGQISGPDGTKDTARYYTGAHAGDSGTDAGLPAGTSARTFGLWVKTVSVATATILNWGATPGSTDARLTLGTTGLVAFYSGADVVNSPNAVNDGEWHFIVEVDDNSATDGQRRKGYIDGKLVAVSTVLNSITLGGANRFRLGASATGGSPFDGQLARAFVYNGALTSDQIRSLYLKGAQDLGPSPKNSGDHVQGFDGTNIYGIFDQLEGQNQVDLLVAA